MSGYSRDCWVTSSANLQVVLQQGVIRTLQNSQWVGADPVLEHLVQTTSDTTFIQLKSDAQVGFDIEAYLSNPNLFAAAYGATRLPAARWQQDLARQLGLVTPLPADWPAPQIAAREMPTRLPFAPAIASLPKRRPSPMTGNPQSAWI